MKAISATAVTGLSVPSELDCCSNSNRFNRLRNYRYRQEGINHTNPWSFAKRMIKSQRQTE